MNEFDFSVLQPFIDDEYITDINYNGRHLWIDHLRKGRYVVQNFDNHHECMQLGYRFANYANLTFNTVSPIVEAETGDLRISLVHSSVCDDISISIRKTPAIMRLNNRVLKKQNYAPIWLLELLAQFVKIKSNMIVSGLPGAGKTELVKYLSQFIQPHQRVITIEDTYEIRYRDLHPKSDCIALKVNNRFSYHDAIKACLRQRPDWMLVSEVRGNEVVNLFQSVSTGATLLSTIHAPSAHHIPRRLLHMFPGVEMSNDTLYQMIFDIIDVGIHVEASISKKGVHRYIKEVVAFEIVDNKPVEHLLYKFNETDEASIKWSNKLNEKKKLYESMVKQS